MSAIWGYINNSGTFPKEIDSTFVNEYKSKCLIDRYESATHKNTYMGCGIQYITKESINEILPIVDLERNYIFTADCVLDNHSEICSELDISQGTPDGSIMYQAYIKWGIDCLPKFRGIFAFALYDINNDKLILATDQTASRCLYYHIKEDTIIFSTLISPIRHIDHSIDINELYIKDYLTAPGLMPNIVPEETPYSGVYKLCNGTYIEIKNHIATEHKYWDPSINMWNPKLNNASEYGKYFIQLFEKCVSDTINVNGEIAIAMSSGFDSASVGVMASKKLKESAKKLYSFTYVPFDKATVNLGKNNILDETKDVMSIVNLYDNIEPSFLCNEGKNCISEITDELNIMEIPFKAFVNMPNLQEIYQKAAQKNCKVVLVGQFGNSTISHGYIDDVLYDLYSKKHYLTFARYLNHYSKTVKESRKEAFKGCYNYFKYAKKIEHNTNFKYSPSNIYLTENILDNYPLKQRYLYGENYFFENIPTSSDLYHKLIYKRAMFTYLGELETKMGLKYGIVLRDPTKDIRMISFCYYLPYKYFAYKGMPRWLIRYNMRDLLPKSIVENWLRYGVQNADYLSRIRNDWDDISNELYDSIKNNNVSSWIDFDKITHMLNNFNNMDYSRNYSDFDDAIYLYICTLFLALNQ